MAKRTVLAFGAICCATGLAWAVDQSILGNSITVKNPSTADKRKVTIKAKEKSSPNTIVGNPIATGGNLQVFLSGANFNNQFFFLPTGTSPTTGKPFWSGDTVKGFKYKDGKGDNGPVKSVKIKKSSGGQFSIKAVALGKLGTVTLVPPNPGTNSCVILDLGGGVTYSVKFGPGDGVIQNKGATLYKQKKPTIEGSCGFISSTTSTTAVVTTTTSTTTTLYGSPSRAFVDRILGLLD
jgi:hypothetical protein